MIKPIVEDKRGRGEANIRRWELTAAADDTIETLCKEEFG